MVSKENIHANHSAAHPRLNSLSTYKNKISGAKVQKNTPLYFSTSAMNTTTRRLFHTFRFGVLDAYKNTPERRVFIEDIVCTKATELDGADSRSAHFAIL